MGRPAEYGRWAPDPFAAIKGPAESVAANEGLVRGSDALRRRQMMKLAPVSQLATANGSDESSRLARERSGSQIQPLIPL
ncbi:hypothetical protein VTI28DRAFT_5223 [Corynascus sepedonium]